MRVADKDVNVHFHLKFEKKKNENKIIVNCNVNALSQLIVKYVQQEKIKDFHNINIDMS